MRAASLAARILGALLALGSAPLQAADKEAAAKAGETSDGWLFLGRRSGDGWRPASASLSSPRYPVKPGQRLVVKQDALVYGSVDCKVIDAAEFKVEDSARARLVVKADRSALHIVAAPLECPSVGRAKTVWAKVKIPGERLVSVEK